MSLTREKFADSRWRKRATQKGRRKSADLKSQMAVGYSVRCNPVDSMSTGGRFSNVAR